MSLRRLSVPVGKNSRVVTKLCRVELSRFVNQASTVQFEKTAPIPTFEACGTLEGAGWRLERGPQAAAGSDVMAPAALLLEAGQRALERVPVQDVQALATAPDQADRIELAERTRHRLPRGADPARDLA